MQIEIFFIAFFIFHAIRGYQKGALLQLTWLIAITILIGFWPAIAEFLAFISQQLLGMSQLNYSFQGFEFVIAYFMIYFILKSLLLIGKNLKIPVLTPLNRVVGSLLAIFKASWLLYLIFQFIDSFWPQVMQPLLDLKIVEMIYQFWQPLISQLMQWLFQ